VFCAFVVVMSFRNIGTGRDCLYCTMPLYDRTTSLHKSFSEFTKSYCHLYYRTTLLYIRTTVLHKSFSESYKSFCHLYYRATPLYNCTTTLHKSFSVFTENYCHLHYSTNVRSYNSSALKFFCVVQKLLPLAQKRRHKGRKAQRHEDMYKNLLMTINSAE